MSRHQNTQAYTLTTSWKFTRGWQRVGFLGVSPPQFSWPDHLLTKQHYPWYQAIVPSIKLTLHWMRCQFAMLFKLIQGIIPLTALSGPITVVQIMSSALSQSMVITLYYFAIINILLAIMNCLPVPVLDVGQVVLAIIEKLLGRAISIPMQVLISQTSFILLILHIIFVSLNDMSRLLPPPHRALFYPTPLCFTEYVS